MKQKQDYIKALEQFFEAADASGDGVLTMEEFTSITSDPHVVTWLSLMEIDISEASELFLNMDSGDGVVSRDEFVRGISHMKGQARSADLFTLQLGQHKLKGFVTELRGDLQALHGAVQKIESLVNAAHKTQLSNQSQCSSSPDTAAVGDFTHLRV